MLFTSCRSKFEDSHLKIVAENCIFIEQCDQYKYLGIWVYKHLTFKAHIEKVCSNAKSCIAILWRMQNFINKKLVYELYVCLIEPQFVFGDVI